jgi:hypothetical protein
MVQQPLFTTLLCYMIQQRLPELALKLLRNGGDPNESSWDLDIGG